MGGARFLQLAGFGEKVLATGRYKTWTLDSGLDYGLDYGLNFGLDFGQ